MELIILTTFTAVVAILIWKVPDEWEGSETARRSLTVLLAVLVAFASVVDLLAALVQPRWSRRRARSSLCW